MAADTELPSPWWSERLLRREYVDRGRTRTEIAERWDCSVDTVSHWLDRHGIEEADS